MRHLDRIVRHAGSLLLGQLATIGFGVADTVMAGRFAAEDLAALSIGAAVHVSIYIGFTGILQALIPIVGHHHGAGAPERAGASFRKAVWLALLLALPGMLLMSRP